MSVAAGALMLLLLAWKGIPIPGRAIAATLILVDFLVADVEVETLAFTASFPGAPAG